MSEVLMEAEVWVAVAFATFIGILLYLGVPAKIGASLDSRGAKISRELDEVRALREEAERVLAEYKARQAEAEQEAETMISTAKIEAERLAAEAKAKAEEFVVRRTKMAETKISQAEQHALAEVRAVAADAAVKAAAEILTRNAQGKEGDKLLAEGLKEVRAKLH